MSGSGIMGRIGGFIDLGGPVVVILLVLSVLALALILWKLAQFTAARVGRHRRLEQVIARLDEGDRDGSMALLAASTSRLGQLLARNAARGSRKARIESETSLLLSRYESGFRALDTIAQLSPLLGLFGTVLGMIDAFRALQEAGASVDPSILAGGIWVALLTTAAGLVVAMPAALALAYFESRVARERALAEVLIEALDDTARRAD